jgi:hypothetical protein
METLLISEQFVSQFKYWRAGQIRTGMRFRNNLFEYVSQFKQDQRPQAFELAAKLNQTGREAIVTASAKQYMVWASLRSRGSAPLEQSSSQIEPFNSTIPSEQLEAALSA